MCGVRSSVLWKSLKVVALCSSEGEALCSGKQKLCVLCMVEVKHCVPAGEKLCV